MSLSRDKIREMLVLQNRLNTQTAGPDWCKRKDVVFENAIIAEAGELLESLGYKWWKKSNIDMDNVRIEVVDLWHFTMSLLMQYHGNDEDAIDEIVNLCSYPLSTYSRCADIESLLTDDVKNFVHVATSYEAYEQDTIAFQFAIMMGSADLDLDTLHSMYVIKNALNKFRQDNGYTTGTYQKIWNGREDNEVAMEQCQGLTYEETLAKLADIYSTL